jgi:predicted SnoaL-like aldol condensation-catalyzing enzyme
MPAPAMAQSGKRAAHDSADLVRQQGRFARQRDVFARISRPRSGRVRRMAWNACQQIGRSEKEGRAVKKSAWGGTAALVLLLGISPKLADSQVNTGPPRSTTEESRRNLEGFARLLYVERNVTAMTRYFDAHLIQHDAEIGDSGHGDDAFLERRRQLHPEQYLPPEQYHTVVDNLMADGDLIAVKSHVYTNPKDQGRVFVDIWRVAGGKFVEHWDVVQPVPSTSLNKATMWCGGASNYEEAGKTGDMVARPACGRSGPAEHRDAVLAAVNAYTAMAEEPRRAAAAVQTFVADDFVQHSPQIPAGKAALAKYVTDRATARATEGRESQTARMLADGDLVLTHRRVTTKADPRGVAHADLYRVRDGRIVEHWDVIQPIPSFSVAGHSMVDGPLEPGRTAGGPPDTAK